ncbi:MAG: hypothetical protein MSH29_01490 [Tenericutes bacterium]|nr:hypothetical protein [Mycoplasmatota bacterium]
MDAIKNDIYLSTIFNACEEKVLTYEELLQKVNLYTKKENFDEETLNYILEEVEKFRIHKKEYSNDEKRTYLSKLMLDENTEKYGTKIVDSMSDAAVDKVFENEVKEIKDEDIDNIISPKKEPVKVKVRVRNEIPNIEVAKEVACDNDKLERALIETYNGVTIEEILNALIDSRKKGMTLPTTQPMEHLVMYYALKGRKGLTLDEKQRILREVKSEKARDKEIVKRVLDKINEENRKNNVSVNANKIEAKKEEKNAIETKEEAVEPVDKLDKQLVRNVAGNNYYLERAILLGSFNGTKLEDILDGIIKLRKNGEDIACTREMNYLVDSYAIFGKLNANILNSTLDKIANVRKEEEKTKKEPVNEEKIEDKNIDSNIELAKELANNSEMLEAALISKAYKGVALESLVKALVDAKKQGINFETNEAMNALISEYENEGKITEEGLKNVKLLLAKERLNREKGYAFANQDYDSLDNNKGVAFAGKDIDSLDDDKNASKEDDKKEQQGIKFSDLEEEDYENVVKNINDAKDSNVRKVEASEERIKKLKKSKSKAKSIALKSLIIVCGFAMLGPEAGILGIGSYNVFAILIRQGKFNPKTKIGKSIKDAVIKIMSLGYSDEDKYDLLKDISKAEQERKEEKGGKTK